jgi:uncharacterized protein GlcG (DUF336 family)
MRIFFIAPGKSKAAIRCGMGSSTIRNFQNRKPAMISSENVLPISTNSGIFLVAPGKSKAAIRCGMGSSTIRNFQNRKPAMISGISDLMVVKWWLMVLFPVWFWFRARTQCGRSAQIRRVCLPKVVVVQWGSPYVYVWNVWLFALGGAGNIFWVEKLVWKEAETVQNFLIALVV